LAGRHAIEAVVPDEAGRDTVHRIIYDELVRGVVSPVSKTAYLDEVARLRAANTVDGLIMGCTEITMLIGQDDFDIRVFDTTRIHAEAAVAFALAGT
jgi:aspartate racemase